MSLRLSKYFGNSAEFWLNLQQHYELEKEREKAKDVLEKIIPFKNEEKYIVKTAGRNKKEKMVN
jgi:plasmid maintenance system antidote protein VapI